MKKALVYCRVSTKEQVKEGYSLTTQEKICVKFAKDNGYKVVKIYRDEGKSATNLNRSALQNLLYRCKQDRSIDAVIVQETDRLTRNVKDHLTIKTLLQEAKVKLLSVAQPMLDDSPEGIMIDIILACVNQFQSDINSRKTKKGMQEKFNLGWWPGLAPLGYLNKKISGKKVIAIDPQKWPFIKEAFEMCLTEDYLISDIRDILYRKGLKLKTNKKIPISTIIKVLKNPFYAGLMRWNFRTKTGNHKPLITLEEHRKILTILNGREQITSRIKKYNLNKEKETYNKKQLTLFM